MACLHVVVSSVFNARVPRVFVPRPTATSHATMTLGVWSQEKTITYSCIGDGIIRQQLASTIITGSNAAAQLYKVEWIPYAAGRIAWECR